jgi:hypothetical protein
MFTEPIEWSVVKKQDDSTVWAKCFLSFTKEEAEAYYNGLAGEGISCKLIEHRNSILEETEKGWIDWDNLQTS